LLMNGCEATERLADEDSDQFGCNPSYLADNSR
jgi:hypothetical protein